MDGIGPGVQDDNRQRKGFEVLLILKVLVDAQNCLESRRGRGIEQVTVAQLLPSHLPRCTHLMSGQISAETPIHVVVEQHPHSRSRSSRNPCPASSRAACACSRSTPSKPSRKPSRVSPCARQSNSVLMGTRVPKKHGAPLTRCRLIQTNPKRGCPGWILSPTRCSGSTFLGCLISGRVSIASIATSHREYIPVTRQRHYPAQSPPPLHRQTTVGGSTDCRLR